MEEEGEGRCKKCDKCKFVMSIFALDKPHWLKKEEQQLINILLFQSFHLYFFYSP